MNSVVRLSQVSKTYHRGDETVEAVRGLSMDLLEREWVAIVGPSGCGKSTLLNLIGGIDRPDAGEIRVCGIDLAHATERDLIELRRQRVGFIFQSFHLMPHLTVEENVALPLSLDGVRDGARVRALIDRVGLGHRLRHYPSELSGGEQQRTAVARALIQKPPLVLADEPTGNLDSESGLNVLELLNELRQEEGTTLLVATHDARISAMADRRILLRDGRVEGEERK